MPWLPPLPPRRLPLSWWCIVDWVRIGPGLHSDLLVVSEAFLHITVRRGRTGEEGGASGLVRKGHNLYSSQGGRPEGMGEEDEPHIISRHGRSLSTIVDMPHQLPPRLPVDGRRSLSD